MNKIDYQKLYSLQDEIMSLIFQVEQEFYLTGGTCLSRFYKNKRYSDDLDFFTHNSRRFFFAIKNIRKKLEKSYNLKIEVDSKAFVRLKVNKLLQLDFVNDSAYRYKEVIVTKDGYLIDNIENILSNKITAVMGRDNPKDIFDILLISTFYSFSWKEIIESAHKKAGFDNDELIVRLKAFPKHLLDKIKLIDKNFLNDFELRFEKIIDQIQKTCF